MRRSRPFLIVIVGLVAFAGLAWLTVHPDSALLDRATSWPVIGPAARTFRAAYQTPVQGQPPSTIAPIAPTSQEMASPPPQTEWAADLPRELRYSIWIDAGTPLYDHPSLDEAPVGRVEHLSQLIVVQRREDWHRIWTPGRGRVWAHLPDYWRESEPPLGSDPIPVGPLPAKALDPDRLARARELLDEPNREERWGPYRVLTDVRDEPLLDRCRELVPQVESAWTERYRIEPVGKAEETLLLFAREDSFRSFVSDGLLGDSDGYSSRGLAAVYAEGRIREVVAATLVHEVTHLLHRRAFGPALPTWLAEGFAEDLAGRLTRPIRLDGPTGWWATGPAAAPPLLVRARAQGSAPSLADLAAASEEDFRGGDRGTLLYASSGLWMGYLLTRVAGFPAYLQEISQGGAGGLEALERATGRSESELEEGFGEWLQLELVRSQRLRGSTSRQTEPPSR